MLASRSLLAYGAFYGCECIACGAMLTRVLGVVSIIIGVAGFVAGKAPAARG
jgi:hypothetical protein